MNHLYEIATGKLISSTSLPIDTVPDGMAVKTTTNTGIWNTDTLDFDPIPEKKPAITRLEFMDLFTDAELAGILTAAKSNVSVEVFVKKLDAASEIKLDDPRTIAGVQLLEAASLIDAGRAAEILNG